MNTANASSPFSGAFSYNVPEGAALMLPKLEEEPVRAVETSCWSVYDWMEDSRGLNLKDIYEAKIYAILYAHHKNFNSAFPVNQSLLAGTANMSRKKVNEILKDLTRRGLLAELQTGIVLGNGSTLRGVKTYQVLQKPINEAFERVCIHKLGRLPHSDSGDKHNNSPEETAGRSRCNYQLQREVDLSTPPMSYQQTADISVVTDSYNGNGQDGQVFHKPQVAPVVTDSYSKNPVVTDSYNGNSCGNVESNTSSIVASTCGSSDKTAGKKNLRSVYKESDIRTDKGEEDNFIKGRVTRGSTYRGNLSRAVRCDAAEIDRELTGLENSCLERIIALSSKRSLITGSYRTQTRRAFLFAIGRGYTPQRVLECWEAYLADNAERNGADASRYEKFPANFLGEFSTLSAWDAKAPRKGPQNASDGLTEAQSSSCESDMNRQTDPKTEPVTVMALPDGTWAYRDRLGSLSCLGRHTKGMSREQAVGIAAEALGVGL